MFYQIHLCFELKTIKKALMQGFPVDLNGYQAQAQLLVSFPVHTFCSIEYALASTIMKN